ncbi:hypothetical protein G6O69_37720 [Pseudenhygromyxa sp. WMMC2535]|uniref:hypothetical protein n=1 Tax=Pseudenhygromyxa sp. WMMC2535 TaxID=2712867 RepID=UPI001551C4DD|nr:hypothetical protein [Pseudenhygromyxa sp. WMMC2535]NVB37276.1 hypothetical protein [Pseudenhygromyxa sp. WMMC2535]NVB43610.1 hypothetical protein [Pseudenhygromyxa sp. WMMC2535]
MFIKGTIYAGRRTLIRERFGEEAWERFEATLRERQPSLRRLITPTSLLEFDDYVGLQALLLEMFYEGNERAYWTLGYQSADWALTEGPYAHLLDSARRGQVKLQPLTTRLWRVYSDEGQFTTEETENGFVVAIEGPSRWHISLEYSAMGYVHRLFELITDRRLDPQRIEGAADNKLGCRYRFEFMDR